MYWLAPVGRGRGIARQAVQLVCQWAFAELGLEQLTLQTQVENLRSQRVAERVGFQRLADPNKPCVRLEQIWFTLTH